MSIFSFVSQYLPNAQQVSAQTGLPVDYILGQSYLESAGGTSNVARNYNNLFGITNPGGGYASYPSPAASFDAYASLIRSPRYAGSYAGLSDPLAIGNAINARGYSTTPDYGSRVAKLIPGIDQALATLGASAGPSPATSTTGGASVTAQTLMGVDNIVLQAAGILLAIVLVGVGLWLLAR